MFTVTEKANNHNIKVVSNYGDNKSANQGNELTTDSQTITAGKDATITFTNSRVMATILGVNGHPIVIIGLITMAFGIIVFCCMITKVRKYN